jgi:hypothetical protein
MKSYYYGVVESISKKDSKNKTKKRSDDSLLDWALAEKDYAFADQLLKKDTVKDFYLEAVNNKLDKLQNQIDELGNPEIGHAIAKKIIKEYDKD